MRFLAPRYFSGDADFCSAILYVFLINFIIFVLAPHNSRSSEQTNADNCLDHSAVATTPSHLHYHPPVLSFYIYGRLPSLSVLTTVLISVVPLHLVLSGLFFEHVSAASPLCTSLPITIACPPTPFHLHLLHTQAAIFRPFASLAQRVDVASFQTLLSSPPPPVHNFPFVHGCLI